MLNGYYIYFGTKSAGVENKVNNQIKELSKFGQCTKIIIEKDHRSTAAEKVIRSFPTVSLGYKFDLYLAMIKSPDYIYIRRTTVDSGLICFMKDIKNMYPKCCIIWELPVYPYFKDSYCNNIKHFARMFPLYIKDVIYRNQLQGYVRFISTFSDFNRIFGINTLKIRNGICVDDVLPITSDQDDIIDIISVAMMSPHHGFERLIKGIADYYQSGGERKIKYHAVGYGSQLEMYKELVKKYSLEDIVVFYGKKTGSELDQLYEKADLAVASLGLYKKGITVGSFIKTGEYLAKGLPMITGSPVDVLDSNDYKLFVEFPNDASPIDINKVVSFYDSIYKGNNRAEVINTARNYAYQKVDMKVAMKSVTDQLDIMLNKKRCKEETL